MLPYYILIIIPLFIYMIGYYKGKRWDKPCIIAFFIILLLMLCLRSIECGTDLKMYEGFYKLISHYSLEQVINFSKKGEVLYYLLNKGVSTIGGNFQFFLSVVAIISLTPIIKFYCKKSKHGLLTIALFLTVAPFTMFFSGLRQSIAMGLVILAFPFVENKKPIKYLILILIATYFHRSASVALLFYPLYYAKITKKWLYFIIPSFVLVYVFNEQIFSYLIGLFNPIYEEAYGYVTATGQYSILILLIIFDIYCFAFPDKDKIDKEFVGLRNILLLATLLQMFVPINPVVMRMNYYALLFIPILIPKVAYTSGDKNNKLLQISVIVMIMFFFSYFIYDGYTGNDVLNIFPYIPFWG